ncbi:phosphatase PAP2 family protein [Sphingomonas sp. G-3-2-10]|uniref:acid phosphatase n=1 Tax=Sphingomonas sp. G-3-2-10 TaxID=2728838 RepID=UPI0032180886
MIRIFLIAAALTAAVPALSQQAAPAPRMEKGYLDPAPVPAMLGLTPPPPASGSPAEARDIEGARTALALRGTPRWSLATSDADLFGPGATGALSCAAGIDIGRASTPLLDRLLRRTIADFGLSGSVAKRTYARPRPFMVNEQPSCTPDWEPMLRRDGSYPSGHSAIGFGWSMILAELLPDRAALLIARGRAFGDSRRICNAHWLSDVEEGRVTATVALARLHADPAFTADLAAARVEARSAKPPVRDCAVEAAALEPANGASK